MIHHALRHSLTYHGASIRSKSIPIPREPAAPPDRGEDRSRHHHPVARPILHTTLPLAFESIDEGRVSTLFRPNYPFFFTLVRLFTPYVQASSSGFRSLPLFRLPRPSLSLILPLPALPGCPLRDQI